MNFDFEAVREKASDILEDTREGLSLMDRYVVRHSVRTRTVITDTKTGKKLSDNEDGYTREFSLIKAVAAIILAAVAILALFVSASNGAKQRKTIKEQKKQIKRMEKACKKANVDPCI